MEKNIILDLDRNDLDNYDDHNLTDSNGNSQLWQLGAAEQLKQHLQQNGKQAKEYKNSFKPDAIHFFHNAICVHGGRGSGKTVFLKHIDKIWQQHLKNEQDAPKLYFLDPIDPTMLHQHDSFASVIIAQLYAAVEKRLKCPSGDLHSTNFYTALRDLANSHGKSSEYGDATGIDRILNYRSGVKVHSYFHEFVRQCCNILECDAVVLRIDDVDMSLDRAFEVLDDVRKFLSCPLIIPVVSGDLALYSLIMQNHFASKLTDTGNSAGRPLLPQITINNEGAEGVENNIDGSLFLNDKQTVNNMIGSLQDAFLTKVFPNHLRINLVPLELFQHRLYIDENKHQANSDSAKGAGAYSYLNYLTDVASALFPLCNGKNRSQQWQQPYNARELHQFVKALPPSVLTPNAGGILPQLAEEQLRWWQSWAEHKQDGANYLNVLSYLQAPNTLTGDNLGESAGLAGLTLFNLTKQVTLSKQLGWGYKDVAAEQATQLQSMPKTVVSGTSSRTRFTKTYLSNRDLLDDSLKDGDKTLRSMPPLEFISNRLRITKATADAIGGSHKHFLYLYTYKSYYQKSNRQTPLIFFSRAFDILACSLIELTGHADNIDWQHLLPPLLRNAPFYSVTALAPLKTLQLELPEEEQADEAGGASEANEASDNTELKQCAEKLSARLETWRQTGHGKQWGDLTPALPAMNLFPLLANVFNMVFTQLHLYRNEVSTSNAMPDEHLSDAIVRFKLMVINAFIFFMKTDGEVTPGNIAVSAKTETIRNKTRFFSSSNTLNINFSDFLNLEGEALLTPELSQLSQFKRQLVAAIWAHPIFAVVDDESKSQDSTESESKSQNEVNAKDEFLPIFAKLVSSKSALTPLSEFESASALLNYLSKPSVIKRNGIRLSSVDVKHWIKDNSRYAQAAYEHLETLLKRDPDELAMLVKYKTYNKSIVYRALKKHFGEP